MTSPTSGPQAERRAPPTHVVLAWAAGPVAFAALMVLRSADKVAQLPVWVYVAGLAVPAVAAGLVDGWHAPGHSRWQRRVPLLVRVLAVTVAIYMTGWGPVLGMAYAFVVILEVEESGAWCWRLALVWTLLNIAVAQALLGVGWIPSFLPVDTADVVGSLAGAVLALVIRMAGATGESKEAVERELARRALHDPLTGLANRALFQERTAAALEAGGADRPDLAVLLFDLDRFKEINDTMGHAFGDRVLCEVSRRMEAALRPADTLARLGGDEFCVLLPGIGHRDTALFVAGRIVDALREPFELDGIDLVAEASCGVAVAPDDGVDADGLLRRADVAMYAAKQAASGVLAYRPELDVHTRSRLSLVAELRAAVHSGQLELHFQPKVALGSGDVEGVEALVRWRHPVHGLLAPIEFIPEAERTGVIGAVSDWVVEEALRTCRLWEDMPDRPPLTVAINLSTHSLEDRTLPGRIARALARNGVPASLLELEITETTLLSDPAGARVVLDELAAMGVVLAIDDFGTGYSSLAYLRDLPVSQLKIDRSFLIGLGGTSGDDALVRSVIDLARNLGLRTVAEGVEDRATASRLAELGCDSIQGFLVSHPLPRIEFDRWLAGYELAAARRRQRLVVPVTVPGEG